MVDVDVDDDELQECVPHWRSDERGLQWVESRVWLPWTRCWAEMRSSAKMITNSDVEFEMAWWAMLDEREWEFRGREEKCLAKAVTMVSDVELGQQEKSRSKSVEMKSPW